VAKRFSGKNVLITGASMGIGESLAILFAKEGANLALAARSAEKLEKVKTTCENYGAKAVVIPTDVASKDQVNHMVLETIANLGVIDILVNNAGYGLNCFIEDLTQEDLADQFSVNVYGCLYAVQAVLPQMKERGDGLIINVSSVAGRRGLPTMGPYCMSKFAVKAMSDSLLVELKPYGVHILSVEPGVIDTPFSSNKKVVNIPETERPKPFTAMPVDRLGKKILNAAYKRKRVLLAPFHAKLLVFLNTFFPSFLDKMILRTFQNVFLDKAKMKLKESLNKSGKK
jgi:short-subunit dehydrogenase